MLFIDILNTVFLFLRQINLWILIQTARIGTPKNKESLALYKYVISMYVRGKVKSAMKFLIHEEDFRRRMIKKMLFIYEITFDVNAHQEMKQRSSYVLYQI